MVRARALALWREVEGLRLVQTGCTTALGYLTSVSQYLWGYPVNTAMLITVAHGWKTSGIKTSERHKLNARRNFFTLRTAVHWIRLTREAVQVVTGDFKNRKPRTSWSDHIADAAWSCICLQQSSEIKQTLGLPEKQTRPLLNNKNTEAWSTTLPQHLKGRLCWAWQVTIARWHYAWSVWKDYLVTGANISPKMDLSPFVGNP